MKIIKSETKTDNETFSLYLHFQFIIENDCEITIFVVFNFSLPNLEVYLSSWISKFTAEDKIICCVVYMMRELIFTCKLI